MWRPYRDDLSAYDDWFSAILHARRPAIVLVDELSSISKGRDAVDGYAKLVKQGRGLGITPITLSQEMSNIARQSTGQATHFCRFGLQREYDRRAANGMLGLEGKHPEPQHKYGFWYVRLDERPYTPTYYPSWRAFF